ncbi:ABC transporter permease [candidate division KSB1 bacterium]|nr:ABC transporter permease [candidate division KSB1 bacterium]NIR69460.1 ABC transporter permease [candidate division KSB1 bacterium]NIS22809.1 ABC transporter permease [candidate division KSB1 bacterium]NIT69649.1 ABC transporter permease [candidate division KSB1 bacterium]NIU23318.1 ABC transporter permease [candidate division KSB1 bacterium]
MQQKGVSVEIEGGSDSVQQILDTFTIEKSRPHKEQQRPYLLEWIGEGAYSLFAHSLKNFFFLMSDIFYWSVVDFFRRKTYRRGEFINQSVLIGVNAVPIVGAMAFLIGLVLALQSTAQLRQFGANRFLVDLVVIAMMREMGPLITAIIVAGRSGSAIASEVATMKITEELDGLTTMSLDPVRFVVIPKMYASIFTMPFLTILADILGIAGGMVIAFFYMDITPRAFLNRMEDVLYFRDIVTGLIKSLVFSTIIVVTGSYFGFRAARGAEEVGKVTTAAVVLAISLVIVADSILGLMFY